MSLALQTPYYASPVILFVVKIVAGFSAGTRRLLIVLGLAYQALDEGTLLCIDEVDASLHTYASEAILKLFCRLEINRNGAQLISITHNTSLMKSSVLRRDQLWFTEKTPCSFVELTTRAGERRLQTWAEAKRLPDLERNVELKRR